MAKKSAKKMSSLKKRGESKKSQGSQVSGASASDARQEKTPRSMARGLGSAFAYGLSKLLDNAPALSGSKNGFLGMEKKSIDISEHAKTLSDSKKKRK